MRTFTLRAGALVLLLVAAAVAVFGRRPTHDEQPTQLTWIATAHQYGPVGYRDPAAAISPDGRWIAYSEGRFLRVRAIDGGPIVDLSWRDNRFILAAGELYDRIERTRRPLWPDRPELSAHDAPTGATVATLDLLRLAVWSHDGQSLAAIVAGRNGSELWTAAADGTSVRVHRLKSRSGFPAWTPRGDVGCIATVDGRL